MRRCRNDSSQNATFFKTHGFRNQIDSLPLPITCWLTPGTMGWTAHTSMMFLTRAFWKLVLTVRKQKKQMMLLLLTQPSEAHSKHNGGRQCMTSCRQSWWIFDCWEYVKQMPDMNMLPSTWAFKIKRYPDGRVKKFKARFCARGDRQKEGIDYFDTVNNGGRICCPQHLLSRSVSFK